MDDKGRAWGITPTSLLSPAVDGEHKQRKVKECRKRLL